MLTPMDIHDHQFKKSFRGYNENEVDDFLDKIVVDFEKLLNETERLKTQLYTTEKELEKYRGLEKTMNDTLIMAQRTADDVIATARKTTDDMKENAARECQQIKDQARYEAKQQIDSAKIKRDAILAEYDKFVREKNAFLLKLRTILESELTITTQMLEDVPNVAEKVKQILPEEKPQPVEEPAPPPVEAPKPEEKPESPVEDNAESNIVDISVKPVTDETKTYKPVKPTLDKEAAK
ncbi:MAG: DivIVA domain-containing protein [Selenomonadaceae bacterium]|nr:DivIVA domain-containing protein [Selenomonadaceae bacterium]